MKELDGVTVRDFLEEIDRHVVAKERGKVIPGECPDWKPGEAPCKVIGKGKPVRETVKVTSADVIKARVWTQQYLCKKHGKFRVLPSFLLPGRQYAVWAVEGALAAKVAGDSIKATCDRWGLWNPTTAGRWLSAVLARLGTIGSEAQRRLSNLIPGYQPETNRNWRLDEVWQSLQELRRAWARRGYVPRPAIYFALTL